MKNSRFKWTHGKSTAEAEGKSANILAWGMFIALVIPAAGLTYVITRDPQMTLHTINSLKTES
jgi:hypothetical protein